MRPLIALYTVLSLPLLAATVRPVHPPDVAAAAYSQSQPDIASNGHGFVAVWWDLRRAEHPNFASDDAIFASRIDQEGHSLDPFGIELARNARRPRIASNGNRYLVGYTDNTGAHAVNLGENGRPDGARRTLASPGALADLDGNGSNYCAVIVQPQGSKAVILDEQGAILHTVSLGDGYGIAVVGVADTFVAVSFRRNCAVTPCASQIIATTIASDGTANQQVVASPELQPRLVRMVSNGNRLLLSWLAEDDEQRVIDYMVLRSSGLLVGSAHRLVETTDLFPNYSSPGLSLGWDGRSFVAAWTGNTELSDVPSRALRIDDTGETQDEPFELPNGVREFVTARSGSNVMLISSEVLSSQPDVVVRAIPSFDALPELPVASLIGFSATTQTEPALASSGTVAAVVAREGDSYGGIGATVFTADGVGGELHVPLAAPADFLLQDGPSIGVGRDVFLAAWRERGDRGTRILAKRIAANGVVLDATPIVIAQEPVSFAAFSDTAIASDGESFLVVWHSPDDEIRARRVRRDGTMIGAAVTVSRHPAAQKRERRTPAIVWTGSTYLVVWNEFLVPEGNVSKDNPTRVAYRAARIAADGTVLDANESATLFELIGAGHGLALARGADRIMLVAATGSYIDTPWSVETLSFDLNGNPLATPLRLANTEFPSRLMHPAVAWDGKTFLAFWSDRGTDSKIRGAVLDGQASLVGYFDVASESSYFPTAASIDRGALLVHTKVAEEQANVARLFARTFTPQPPRRRPVRH